MVEVLPARTLAAGVCVALLSWGLAAPASAGPPPPAPTTSDAGPAPTEAAPQPVAPSVAAAPGPTPTSPQALGGSVEVHPAAGGHLDAAGLSLAVTPQAGPVADAFYEDLGAFAFAGRAALPDGSVVEVQRQARGGWTTVVSAVVTGGTYAGTVPVEAAGEATFRSSATGTEGAVVTSSPVTVTVHDATVGVAAAPEVDSLQPLRVTGAVVPARAGVEVLLEVRSGTSWKRAATTTTAADGTYATSLTYGKARLERYGLRASTRAVNRPRWERSTALTFTRIAVLDAQVEATTDADVAKTYRKGCPVGPSELSTVHLNFYGRDGRMHRGVIIIRTDLRQEIVRGFGSALDHRFAIAKMKNPNAYGGNDPKQMEANNTSGFNCRKVVGNPYKMSPHSYGIALDVNTVQNPYRDVHGKWWPSNGKKYRDRTPLKKGMLGLRSWLTKSLRSDDFFWGGLWDPGKDYQHFEYRG